MGSYQQVIVGGLLLLCAFVFGKYINRQPRFTSKSVDSSAYDEPRILQLDSTGIPNIEQSDSIASPSQTSSQMSSDSEMQNSDPDDRGPTLRDRILSNRNRTVTEKPSDVVTINENLAIHDPTQSVGNDRRGPDEIIRPDFSHLQPPTPGLDPSQNPESVSRSIVDEQQSADLVLVGPGGPSASAMPIDPAQRSSPVGQSNNQEAPLSKRDRMLQSQTTVGQETLRGQLVRVRDRDSALTIDTEKFISHRTTEGDTLRGISEKYYGRPNYYLDVYLANRNVLDNLSDIPAGIELRIPVYDH